MIYIPNNSVPNVSMYYDIIRIHSTYYNKVYEILFTWRYFFFSNSVFRCELIYRYDMSYQIYKIYTVILKLPNKSHCLWNTVITSLFFNRMIQLITIYFNLQYCQCIRYFWFLNYLILHIFDETIYVFHNLYRYRY